MYTSKTIIKYPGQYFEVEHRQSQVPGMQVGLDKHFYSFVRNGPYGHRMLYDEQMAHPTEQIKYLYGGETLLH